MWHFGFDSPSEYTGDQFEVAWEDGEDELMRIYTKDMNGLTRIREHQEYPNKRFVAAMDEKLTITIEMSAVWLNNSLTDNNKVNCLGWDKDLLRLNIN